MGNKPISDSLRGSLRQNHRMIMCREWVKANRPDVYDAITKVVDKRFPPKGVYRSKIDTPKSILEMGR